MLTKEDLMKLSKERLAELLVEAINQQTPVVHTPFSQVRPLCYEPDGICTNPQRDCINCPKRGTDRTVITTTDATVDTIKHAKYFNRDKL